jgi:hypothetical protein
MIRVIVLVERTSGDFSCQETFPGTSRRYGFGGAGVAPAGFRRDTRTTTAGETPAPPNPADIRGKLDGQAT